METTSFVNSGSVGRKRAAESELPPWETFDISKALDTSSAALAELLGADTFDGNAINVKNINWTPAEFGFDGPSSDDSINSDATPPGFSREEGYPATPPTKTIHQYGNSSQQMKSFFTPSSSVPSLGSYAVYAPPPIEFPLGSGQVGSPQVPNTGSRSSKKSQSVSPTAIPQQLPKNQMTNSAETIKDYERQINLQKHPQTQKMFLHTEPKISAPVLKVLDSEVYPYPKFWIKTYHLRPSVVVLVENCTINLNNLILLALPLDPETKEPLSNARLECAAEVINEELTNELQPKYGTPAVKFSDMKIIGDRTLGSKQGNDILLSFVLLSKHKYPPVIISNMLCPSKIRVFNRFNELPAPNIIKVVPNVIMCNQPQEITVFGQLFKKGKGVTAGITNLGIPSNLSAASLNETFPPVKTPPPQVVKVTSEYQNFSFPLCNPYEGYTLINASNDQNRYGLGRLIFFQKEPTFQSEQQQNQYIEVPRGQNNSSNIPGPYRDDASPSGSDNSPMSMESAAYFGNFSQLQNLLSKGVAVDSMGPQGNSALYWAAFNGNVEAVVLLLKSGANVNLQSKHTRETALHAASRGGHELIVKLLLQNRASPNVPNVMGNLPMHLAAINGNVPVMLTLIKVTENLNQKDRDHLTPLHYAVMKRHSKVAKLLIKVLDDQNLSLSKKDDMGYTPLHWSISLQTDDISRCLVEHGADLNKVDVQGETPLFLAVSMGAERAALFLLQNGAKTTIRNNQDNTVLDIAQTARLKGLILKFAAQPPKSRTPLVIVENKTTPTVTNAPKDPARVHNDMIRLRQENIMLLKQLQELTRRLKITSGSPAPTVTKETDVHDGESDEDPDEEPDDEFDAEDEDTITFCVCIKDTGKVLGEVQVARGSTLQEVRKALTQDSRFPTAYTFWFEKMKSLVEEWQESKLKAEAFGKDLFIQVFGQLGAIETPTTEVVSKPVQVEKREESKQPQQLQDVEEFLESKGAPDGGDDPVPSDISDFWYASYEKDTVVQLDEFVQNLKKSFATQFDKNEAAIVDNGLRDFFGTLGTQKGGVSLADLLLFLKIYGPIEKSQQKVLNTYKEPYFHGFITFDDAKKLLKTSVGGFLIRYSQSLLHKGCFVLNVNKGKGAEEGIENYVIRYHLQWEKFIFYNKPYDTLKKFIEDPIYSNILKLPIENRAKFTQQQPSLAEQDRDEPASSTAQQKAVADYHTEKSPVNVQLA